MTEPTDPTTLPVSTSRLVRALTEAGAPTELIDRACRNEFHDFLSPLDFPDIALHEALRAAGLHGVAAMVIDGVFDATPAESEAWARSPEGQAAFRELVKGSDLFRGNE